MLSLSRGQKSKLDSITSAQSFSVGLGAVGPGLSFDISCFGVDAADKLSDDRYFIFFNQPASPEGAIKLAGARGEDTQSFDIDLSRLPQSIRKLVFAITIDGAGEMKALKSGHLRLVVGGSEVARFSFDSASFGGEKAIIAGEIYFKDAWRIAAVAQGFSGGLSALLKHFGGQESEEAAPAAPAVAPKVSLDKDRALQVKLEKQAPQLVSLSKTLAVSLEKSGLLDEVARVALVLDASGSMSAQYSRGKVQAVVDRIATLAMRLDDDGELDTWGYASKHRRLPAVTLSNISGYVPDVTSGGATIIKGLGYGNNEPPVMREVLAEFRSSRLPALIVFVTDGGITQGSEIQQILAEASRFPIFWQFVGLGGHGYGVLKELDTMSGRAVDNAGFFHVDDIEGLSDAALYDRLLSEFPTWLREARRLNIVR